MKKHSILRAELGDVIEQDGLWFVCEYPERPLDIDMLMEPETCEDCVRCLTILKKINPDFRVVHSTPTGKFLIRLADAPHG